MNPTPTPPLGFDHDFERGLRNRRAAMSDPFVDRAIGQAHAFNADFQNFITRYAWHGVWGRPGLDWSSRRLIVQSQKLLRTFAADRTMPEGCLKARTGDTADSVSEE